MIRRFGSCSRMRACGASPGAKRLRSYPRPITQRPASVLVAASRTRAAISAVDRAPRIAKANSAGRVEPHVHVRVAERGVKKAGASSAMVIEAGMRQAVAPVPSGLRRLSAWMIDYFLVVIDTGLIFFGDLQQTPESELKQGGGRFL